MKTYGHPPETQTSSGFTKELVTLVNDGEPEAIISFLSVDLYPQQSVVD